MMYAKSPNGANVEAEPGGRAVCPGCGKAVLAKCGEIKIWHWAHDSGVECDPWWECETEWHRSWKMLVKEEYREVVIGGHRADIAIPGPFQSRIVIELQHSSVSPQMIREREEFYRNMVWLFDAKPFFDNFELRNRGKFYSFRWKHPRQSMWSITKRLYLDLSQVAYFYDNPMLFEV
jgi:competence CoiA-like predicted nuclease